jgi:hypothetical protein
MFGYLKKKGRKTLGSLNLKEHKLKRVKAGKAYLA